MSPDIKCKSLTYVNASNQAILVPLLQHTYVHLKMNRLYGNNVEDTGNVNNCVPHLGTADNPEHRKLGGHISTFYSRGSRKIYVYTNVQVESPNLWVKFSNKTRKVSWINLSALTHRHSWSPSRPVLLQLQLLSVDASPHKDEWISAPPYASFCSELIMDLNQNKLYIPVILLNPISGLVLWMVKLQTLLDYHLCAYNKLFAGSSVP